MRTFIKVLCCLCAVVLSLPASAASSRFVIGNVTIVDVETGTQRQAQSVVIDRGLIAAIGPSSTFPNPKDAVQIDGTGKFLIPGLWDMHVHSHRERRWEYHYPLFRAYGVVGVRDAGSHLGSALVAMERAKVDPLAPRVVWGSPIIDGAPPYNSFGLSAEDEMSGRVLVREMKRYGFDFVKVYDRLTPEAYLGITDEARKLGMRVEGHVPLALSPDIVVDAGQTLIDHFTLVLENCLPGEIARANEAQRASPRETDALDMLMDDQLAGALDTYDSEACGEQFASFAKHRVWQVPTLIEMRGYFHANDPLVNTDPRTDLTTPALLAEWVAWGKDADPASLANGRKVLAAQMAMIRPMQGEGVGIMTGTDASSEPWVFAGASVHDEMAMLVAAGLSPSEALRAATLNPLVYLGRSTGNPVIGVGERADLVLLGADPLSDIANTTSIAAVFARGQYHDRASLDDLLDQGRSAALLGLQ